ncbi:MAG: CopG family transcriptional regulator [Cyanobacteria bacterium CRU_2_1]|nr:CopG family transcriptional regulator [Cyanobacteria bacterium RU_5_0]NJR59249.1 CopG family transcriptional regulator [Cyanobacteria bacterium CRU_2_1]
MTREKLLRVRLSNKEYEWLKDYAEATDRQISEVIRDYIKRLPRKPEDGSR